MNGALTAYYMSGLLGRLAYKCECKKDYRDVKLTNYLINQKMKHDCFIDFGLCDEDMYFDNQMKHQLQVSYKDDNLLYPQRYQSKPKMIANRAGTRGFRAPEVLISVMNQSMKIYIWNAGVALLSILSQRYQIFRSPDYFMSFCEIAVITGTENIHNAALEWGLRVRFLKDQGGYY